MELSISDVQLLAEVVQDIRLDECLIRSCG